MLSRRAFLTGSLIGTASVAVGACSALAWPSDDQDDFIYELRAMGVHAFRRDGVLHVRGSGSVSMGTTSPNARLYLHPYNEKRGPKHD